MTEEPLHPDPAAPSVTLDAAAESPPFSSRPSPLPRTPSKWNTEHLPQRILADIAAAACASTLVAPLITIIDRYAPLTVLHTPSPFQLFSYLMPDAPFFSGIIENASQRAPLLTSVRTSVQTLLLRPTTFLTSRPFGLISLVYFTTYITANTTDTLTSTLTARPASHTTAGASKFFATSAANMSLCLYKDSQFTRIFGPLNPPAATPVAALAQRSIPLASYALFALRDSLTVFASFNLPPRLAPLIPLSAEIEKQVCSRATVAQLLTPAGAQLFSTPLHLLGLDLYNRPRAGTLEGLSRWRKVARDWGGSCLARMARVIPAFGVGGVVNSGVRRALMVKVEA